jgi:class 3 adenylate cyclase
MEINKTSEVKTIPAKYIFLDVVGFTHNRSVEAQSDIIDALNKLVELSVLEQGIPKDNVIFIPTGDGICIVLLNVETPYDVHMLLALRIIKYVSEFVDPAADGMRYFQIRVDINSNTDNLITDINGNRNIAGAGISMASRIMDIADGGQILVGQSVYDTLRYRERYMSSFRPYQATVKHGIELPVYQFIAEGHNGLNLDVPQIFRTKEPNKLEEPRLGLRMACYIAHAIKNRGVFLQHLEGNPYAKMLLLWMLSGDTKKDIEASGMRQVLHRTYKAGEAGIEEQLNYYSRMEDNIIEELGGLIFHDYILTHGQYFNLNSPGIIINQKGKDKLKQDWPDIWEKFDLDNAA